LIVGLWGYFLVAAVYDPDGGIKALWPIFGIANQLLAATALCLATTMILKMQLKPAAPASFNVQRSPLMALVTFVPLLWLLAVTGTASVQKIWHSNPKIGFLAGAAALEKKAAEQAQALAGTAGDSTVVLTNVRATERQAANLKLDAFITAFFLVLVAAIFLLSLREWILLLARKKLAELRETPPTWLPDYAIVEGRPLKVMGLFALLLALARELSGEAAIDRLEHQACVTSCAHLDEGEQLQQIGSGATPASKRDRSEAYLAAAERRFEGVNRCC
jgi:carbon starvation protein